MNWFHPLALPLLYGTAVFIGPFVYLRVTDSELPFLGDVDGTLLLSSVIIMTAWAIGTVAALRRSPPAQPRNHELNYRTLRALGRGGTALVAGLLTYRLYSRWGQPYGVDEFLSFDSASAAGAAATALVLPVTLLLALASLRLSHRLLDGVDALLLLAVAGAALFTGNRSQTLFIVVLLVYLYDREVRPLRLRQVVAGLLVLSLVMGLSVTFRSGNTDFGNVIASSLAVPVGITNRLLEEVPNNTSHYFGSTYVAGVKYLPPGSVARALYGEVDGIGKIEFRQIINAEDADHGFGFGLTPEAYLNFGWLGLAVIPAALGWLLGWSYRRARQNPARALDLFYPVLITTLPLILRTDFLSQLKQIGYPMLALGAAFYLARYTNRPAGGREDGSAGAPIAARSSAGRHPGESRPPNGSP